MYILYFKRLGIQHSRPYNILIRFVLRNTLISFNIYFIYKIIKKILKNNYHMRTY